MKATLSLRIVLLIGAGCRFLNQAKQFADALRAPLFATLSNKGRGVHRIVILIIATLLIPGCSGPIYVYIFNNTNSIVIAQALNESTDIEPKSQNYFRAVNEFELCINGDLYTYSIQSNPPPGKYYGNEHFPKYSVHFELQRDGVLYLAMPEAEFPLKNNDQPKGFPILPSPAGGCNA